MKNFIRISLLLTTIIILGCATGPQSYYRYVGPTNRSQQDWMNDRYACLKETQQRISNTAVNGYGGASSSTVMPTCSAFNACLASRGFYRQDTTDVSVFNNPGNFSVPQGSVINCSN